MPNQQTILLFNYQPVLLSIPNYQTNNLSNYLTILSIYLTLDLSIYQNVEMEVTMKSEFYVYPHEEGVFNDTASIHNIKE